MKWNWFSMIRIRCWKRKRSCVVSTPPPLLIFFDQSFFLLENPSLGKVYLTSWLVSFLLQGRSTHVWISSYIYLSLLLSHIYSLSQQIEWERRKWSRALESAHNLPFFPNRVVFPLPDCSIKKKLSLFVHLGIFRWIEDQDKINLHEWRGIIECSECIRCRQNSPSRSLTHLESLRISIDREEMISKSMIEKRETRKAWTFEEAIENKKMSH